MKKIPLLIFTLLTCTTLIACQSKNTTNSSKKNPASDSTIATESKKSAIEGSWLATTESTDDISLIFIDNNVTFQKKIESGYLTFSPLTIKQKGRNDINPTWQFTTPKQDITVVKKLREADPIFTDSNQEITKSITSKFSILPESVKIDRKNHRISYSLKQTTPEIKTLVEKAHFSLTDNGTTLNFHPAEGKTITLKKGTK